MTRKLYIFILIITVILSFITGCNSGTVPYEPSKPPSLSENNPKEEIAKKQFILKNESYSLNAIYTYINDEEKHPSVLLIPGSGPSDCDSTVGALKPLADIADALAKEGICSLRIDKRTLNYSSAFGDGGLEEEYLSDCRAAITWLSNQPNVGNIYLLGHSLGGQIACILQQEIEKISGTICFNSSLRHLADIFCDQYSLSDPANKEQYRQYSNMAKSSTVDNANGLYYFYGARDYYWASYNEYNFINLAKTQRQPLLVINSTNDLQIFEADIILWESTLKDSFNATVIIDHTISHYGYEINLSSPNAFLQKAEFPQKIINTFADFINSAEQEK